MADPYREQLVEPGQVAPLGAELVLVDDQTHPYFHAGRAAECAVFLESGYFASPLEYDQKYGPYDPFTDMIIAKIGDEVAGVVRVIKPNPRGFITINDARNGELTIDDAGYELLAAHSLDHIIECNLTVLPAYRDHPFHPQSTVNQLVSAVVAYAVEFAKRTGDPNAQARAIVSLDSRYFRLVSRQFPGALAALGPAQMYWNSVTIPALVDGVRMLEYDRGRKSPLLATALGRLAYNES